jgi:hypothetical protein
MIKRIFYKAAIFLVCTCITSRLIAQQGIVVSATVNSNRVMIGQPLTLTLSVEVPENDAIRFFSIDTIPHFEFLDKQGIDTTNTNTGTKLTQKFKLISFDSGSWVIPAFALAENISTDSIPVEVVFSPFDPNQPYHDIKDVIDVEEEKKQEWWWYAIGGGILLLLIVYVLLRKKKTPKIKVEAPPVDPYEEAMKELEKLKVQRPEIKQYYSSMIDIFRVYVYRRKNIQSLYETTDDLVLQLRSLQLGADQLNQLAQALRLGDFVKFAKYQPDETDNEGTLEIIRRSINEIEKTVPPPNNESRS